MTSLLALRDVHAHYGDSHVLRGISLEIAPAVSFGLLGRNGMGKTTLIRTAMGYLRASAGAVAWNGRAVTGAAPERMARLGIGYVPEGRGIFANLSVRENLVMAARAGPEGARDDDDIGQANNPRRRLATEELAFYETIPSYAALNASIRKPGP